MNEQLIVKNFGPIKDATVDFKKVTVFIGPTGGGKSTLAKLAAISKNENYSVFGRNRYDAHSFLKDYGLEGYKNKSSTILIVSNFYHKSFYFEKGLVSTYLHPEIEQKHSNIIKDAQERLDKVKNMIESSKLNHKSIINNTNRITKSISNSLDVVSKETITYAFNLKPVYIPSERIFLSSIEYSWAGLMRDDINISKVLLEFANLFSSAKKEVKKIIIPLFNVTYVNVRGQDFIKIPQKKAPIKLLETASGIQSVTPMLVLLEHLSRQKEQAQSFIVEEPELNLYPTAQQGLLNWLVEKCTAGENDLTITTHSPYILSHLNLLLYAYQVAEKHPERADDVAKIVPRESWINPKEFAAYRVEGQKEGGVHSIVNPETGLISYNDLDALAGNSATEFDQLLDINAGLEVE